MLNSVVGNSGEFNFNMKPMTYVQQEHMKKVFATLSGGIIATAGGAYVSFNYFAMPPFLATILQFCAVMYILSTANSYDSGKVSDPKRFIAMGLGSFFTGCSIAPLLSMAIYVNPALIAHAFFITAAIFLSFFVAACYSNKRASLYVGSLLGAASSYLSMVAIANIFFRSHVGHTILLFGGLFVGVGYLYYYTQKTLQDVERGNKDYVLHGLQFYLQLVSVFVRILIILMDKERKSRDDERKRRD